VTALLAWRIALLPNRTASVYPSRRWRRRHRHGNMLVLRSERLADSARKERIVWVGCNRGARNRVAGGPLPS